MERHPLIQPTDSYADLTGNPAECGPLAYRFIYYDDLNTEVSYMKIDLATKEYYMDVTDHITRGPNYRAYLVLLEVSMPLYPDVTPVFVFIDTEILCPL